MFLDVSDGKPGMLVPVFSSQNTNMPYVQQMDEFLQVREVLPFLEYEHYPTIPFYDEDKLIAMGDAGLVAFRSPSSEIVCGKVQEIFEYLAINAELVAENAFLHAQLLRIVSAEFKPSYESWRRVSTSCFENEDQRRFWVDSEHQLFQKQKKIWAEIEPQDPQPPRSGDAQSYVSLVEYGTEFLIRWLSDRSNFRSKNWTKIWHHVHEQVPLDDRLPEIALAWLYSIDNEDGDFEQTRTLIFALLENWERIDKDAPELGGFLAERLADNPELLFIFVRPRRLFSLLILFISDYGEPEDLLKIFDFAADVLATTDACVVVSDAIDFLIGKRINDDKNMTIAYGILGELQLRIATLNQL